ncbi:hypothetical protein NBRC116584_22200 [Hydrogenophaga sp. 5NK40-0174]
MRKKDEGLHERRKEEILVAAARVFRLKGFHLARTEDICAEASLSAGTVFRYFPDKRAMIDAIAEIEFANHREQVRSLATKEGLKWMARVKPGELTSMLQVSTFGLGTDSWLELARDPHGKERLLAFDAELRATLTCELTRGQEEGWVRKDLDTAGTADIVLAIFSGLSFDSELGALSRPNRTARAIADLFKTFILA